MWGTYLFIFISFGPRNQKKYEKKDSDLGDADDQPEHSERKPKEKKDKSKRGQNKDAETAPKRRRAAKNAD